MTEATVLLMGADNPERSAMVNQTLEKLTVEAKFVLMYYLTHQESYPNYYLRVC